MIDTAQAASAAVQGWLDTLPGADGSFRVKAVADGGPVWRAVTGRPGTHLGGFCARVDKATGSVEAGFGPQIGPSARDGYRQMMRTTVVPQLRAHGFTGSGRRFIRQAPQRLETVTFQQSQGNTWMAVKFTADVSAASPSSTWTARLGSISHHGYDHWWTVWAGFPSDDVAADLITAIRDHAVPAIDDERDPPVAPTAETQVASLGQRIRTVVASRLPKRGRA